MIIGGMPFFLGGYGFTFEDVVSVNTANYNLRTRAIAAGWNSILPLTAKITINPGVYVYGDTVVPDISGGIDASGSWPVGSSLEIENNGYVMGQGGHAFISSITYYYNYHPIAEDEIVEGYKNGGAAILTSIPTIITNASGYILGGGGAGANIVRAEGYIYTGGGGAGGGMSGSSYGGFVAGGGPGLKGLNGQIFPGVNPPEFPAPEPKPISVKTGGSGGRIVVGVNAAAVSGDTTGLGGDEGASGANISGTSGFGSADDIPGGSANTRGCGGGGAWGQPGGGAQHPWSFGILGGGLAGYAVKVQSGASLSFLSVGVIKGATGA